MPFPDISNSNDKESVIRIVNDYLVENNITVASVDSKRPWGGFLVIDEASTERFIELFFPAFSYDSIAQGLSLTPKILIIDPNKRLSWQYHHRRAEFWRIITGPVGVVTSENDEQFSARPLHAGEVLSVDTETRHRLIGLESRGVVAEFWKHTDPEHPSDEQDIVRVSDDFSRH